MRFGSTTIVTATYNKEEYFSDAIESVLNQTRTNWRWWIILDGANGATTDLVLKAAHRDSRITPFIETVFYKERKEIYRPSLLMNKYFPLISTDYFCWLSDDDIMEPNYIQSLAGVLDDHTDWDIAFGYCKYLVEKCDCWDLLTYLGKDENNCEYSANRLPLYALDGGQILQTKESYSSIKWQFPCGWSYGNNCDGLYLNALAKKYIFHPVNQLVLTHRRTWKSENTKALIE